MAPELLEVNTTMAGRKPEPSSQPKDRDRVDLRIDPEILPDIRRFAKARGLTVSAYIRQAVLEFLGQDRVKYADAPLPRKRRGS